MMIGSDTSGLEVNPPSAPAGTGIPVHRYLLVDQGVHIGEFHNLEDLSRARAYITGAGENFNVSRLLRPIEGEKDAWELTFPPGAVAGLRGRSGERIERRR